MNPEFLAPLIPVVAIIAFAAVKIARIRANALGAGAPDVVARLESLEHTVGVLQQDLSETQDRLDFAERVLSQAREERRLGG